MCAVSMIMDMGRHEFWPKPNPNLWPTYPPPKFDPDFLGTQPIPPLPPQTDEQKLREFLKLYEAAKAYDRETAQPDCEDPEKTQVLQRILERLDEIEKRLPAA